VSLFDEPKSFASFYMKKAGISRYDLLRVISHGIEEPEGGEEESGETRAEEAEERARRPGPDPSAGRWPSSPAS